jgi:PhnB protein
MKVNAHLGFGGQCEEAFKFYERCLNAKIQFSMTYGESPMADQVPANWRNKIVHASLAVGGDLALSGADAPPDRYQKPQGFSVAIDIKDPGEADHIFAQLAEKGTVQMPMQETFWALRFGMLVDRFGIPWMMNCSKPMA